MSDLLYAPPPFDGSEGTRIIFVDFLSAHYDITFHTSTKTAAVRSEIVFRSEDTGWPAFELNIRPHKVSAHLNGEKVTCDSDWAPGTKAPLMVLKQEISPGLHRLTVRHQLEDVETKPHPIRWDEKSVGCIFHMSDIFEEEATNRFLGSYLPSNFEFDHFKISMHVEVFGGSREHTLISNTGKVSASSPDVWDFEYPAHFTTSFPWFHLLPAEPYKFLNGLYETEGGRQFPIYIYGEKGSFGDRLEDFFDGAKRSLKELEVRFGPFPYPAVTILTMPDGWGGMEHAGATATDFASIRHELDHCYFARCIAPASGSAGWIDEAIASWGDEGYSRSADEPKPALSGLAFDSPYARITKVAAYSSGREFLTFLDNRTTNEGGLEAFLRMYFERKRYQSISVNEFKAMLEGFFGNRLDAEFDKYVFGRGVYHEIVTEPISDEATLTTTTAKCPHRPFHSAEQLRQQLFPY
ncbi:MAG: M1 family metallopeptidase [Alphaproteobacteria bacterium]|nr:M1 family metallopeptidase [Alphaproteobacteria bacterium]